MTVFDGNGIGLPFSLKSDPHLLIKIALVISMKTLKMFFI